MIELLLLVVFCFGLAILFWAAIIFIVYPILKFMLDLADKIYHDY